MKGNNSTILGEISQINDDNRLLEIFEKSDDFEIRYAIVNLIDDDGILYRILSTEENPFIKGIALERISTDLIGWDDFKGLEKYEKISYIERCNDESLIYSAALNDEDFHVRTAAIYRISDTDSLSKIASSHSDYDTRIVCYKKLNGQSLMEEIKGENITESRISLVEGMASEKFLKDIMVNDPDREVKTAALKRLMGTGFYFKVLKDVIDSDNLGPVYDKVSFIERASDESEVLGLVENDDFHLRAAAIHRISDWDFLSRMADTHPDYTTRLVLYKKLKGWSFLDEITGENLEESHKSLVKHLDNENFIKDIAFNDSSPAVKIAALKKLDSPKFYLSIVKNAENENEVTEIIANISDESQLFYTAVIGSSSEHIVKNAINNIANPQLLFELYRRGPDLIRKTAMRKLILGNVFSTERIADKISIDNMILSITPQDVLADMAMNDSSWRVRMDVVAYIEDADVLADIAKSDSDQDVRIFTVKRIEDTDLLLDLAMNDSDQSVRRAAVKCIRDTDLLADIAENNSIMEIRRIAAQKIGRTDDQCETEYNHSNSEEINDVDNNALADIAMNGSNDTARFQAVENITDEDILYDIAINCNHFGIAATAASNITDENILIDITKGTAPTPVRETATEKINDKNVLAEIALNDPDYNVRWEAIKKINDYDILEEVFRKDSTRQNRMEALKRIRNSDKLKKLLLEDHGYLPIESYTSFERNYDKTIYESMGTETYDWILDMISDESSLRDLVYEKLFGDFRLLVVQRLRSEDVLRDLALNDLDYRIRRKAIRNRNLSDEETLVKIFQKDRNDVVRLEALRHIHNPDFIEELADDLNPLIRAYALERLERTYEPNDDSFSSQDIDLTSIEKTEDENVLYAMANHAPSSSIRRYAFDKITDINILVKLVCNNREFANRALKKINDKKLLLNIALYCNDPAIQRKAVKKIDDEEFLLDAVQANPYNDISQYVVDRIRDESRLEVIAFNNSNPFNRKAAVNKIQSPDILIRLGEVECEEIVCNAIVRKCHDRGLLEYIGLSNPCKTVRRYVGDIIDDDKVLCKLASKECEFDNRREMISRIGDEKCVVSLLKRESNEKVFKGVFKIADTQRLIDLARKSNLDVAKKYALKNINDMSILRDFICSSPFTSREPKDKSTWKGIQFTYEDITTCLSILSRQDFNDIKMIEEFLIENNIYMCAEIYALRDKVEDIPSIYRIVLNCKSSNVRRVFKDKLKYQKSPDFDDKDEDDAPKGLGALFRDDKDEDDAPIGLGALFR